MTTTPPVSTPSSTLSLPTPAARPPATSPSPRGPGWRHPLRWLATGAVVAWLAACGGGGSSSSTSSSTPADGNSDTRPSPQRILTGFATFDYVPSRNGQLVYSETEARPVRGVDIEILDAQGHVVATAVTDATGRYTASVPAGQALKVQMLARFTTRGVTTQVTDNTQGDGLYALVSPLLAPGATSADMHARSGWTGRRYGEPRAAAPFAILDTAYRSQSRVLAIDPDIPLRPLVLHWSPSNKPAFGELAAGDIGTTHFKGRQGIGHIYVLGFEDVDTDEHDESVVAHEWGHYYQWAFSRDDSPGGEHAANDRLDLSLAFSEGWGNAWSAIATDRNDYSEALGVGQAHGFSVPISPARTTAPGWFSEASVGALLWQFHQQAGLGPIHAAMRQLASSPAFTSIHAFAHAVRQVDTAAADRLDPLLAAQSIVTSARVGDAFGTGETHDGGLGALTTPVYLPVALGSVGQACNSSAMGTENKLGNWRRVKVDIPSTGRYRLGIGALRRSDGTAGVAALTAILDGNRVFAESTNGIFVTDLDLPPGPFVMSIADGDVLSGASAFRCVLVLVNRLPSS